VDESQLPVDDWSPQPGASDTRLVLDAIGGLVQPALVTSRRLLGAVVHPTEAYREVRTLVSGAATFLAGARPTPPTPIHGRIGPQRRWTWAHATLADTKAIRMQHGGTVNDVVLTAITRGFRDLLETEGEDPAKHQIHSLVPVSVRVEHGVMDNEVAALVVDLPVRFATPELRLEAIRCETERLKASSEAEATETVTRLAELVPAPFMAFGTRATAQFLHRLPQRNITMVTTNVPGPQFPLYAAGRRMLAYYPYVPVAFGVRYGIAILSYDGDLYFGLTGDRELTPDLEVLAKGIEAGFAELLPDGAAPG
jgi:diacylglycerol O-acyltransferase